MLDHVHGHPTIVFADSEFAYDAQKQKQYKLDELKNLLDLKTGEKIGKWLMPSSLANTPRFRTQTLRGGPILWRRAVLALTGPDAKPRYWRCATRAVQGVRL
jgi:hypothetical protein